jgi:hypothetical protein
MAPVEYLRWEKKMFLYKLDLVISVHVKKKGNLRDYGNEVYNQYAHLNPSS